MERMENPYGGLVGWIQRRERNLPRIVSGALSGKCPLVLIATYAPLTCAGEKARLVALQARIENTTRRRSRKYTAESEDEPDREAQLNDKVQTIPSRKHHVTFAEMAMGGDRSRQHSAEGQYLSEKPTRVYALPYTFIRPKSVTTDAIGQPSSIRSGAPQVKFEATRAGSCVHFAGAGYCVSQIIQTTQGKKEGGV